MADKGKSKSDVTEKIVSLSKRRGFVFQSSEIYGGLNGCYDYGPLGVELLRNIKEAWWKEMTYRENIEGLDASILMHPRVWEASGHVENFSDPMVDCKSCKSRYRVDVLFEMISAKVKEAIYKKAVETSTPEAPVNNMEDAEKAFLNDPNIFLSEIPCPNCGNKNTFTDARSFNLMFKTYVGPLEDSSNVVYLRPETAQGIYVNFNNVKESSRQKLPFGIAQIGKAFRNEINTKNFLFRTREFEQMEMQFFINPAEDGKWYDYWREERFNWFTKYGMKKEKLKLHIHEKLAHYAKAAVDIEFEFPFGWGEIEGIHNRTDFDLKRHTEFSGKKIEYFDDQTKERFTPYIIETSAGASRSFFAFLCNAYDDEEVAKENSDGTTSSEVRTVLHFHPALAPIKAAVFPLVNRDGMQDIASNITEDLRKNFKVFYDDSGAVGRRYRRQDECGTPFCITVDSDTLTDNTVTVRERDSMKQERIQKDNLKNYIEIRVAHNSSI
ncbi:MAG: glycine--tRNA ligase [bacterium]|nr:glycine--tRNA ligase [bacterium]